MYHVNVSKLNGLIAEKNTTKEALSEAIGINRSTFFRRLKSNSLTIGDIHGICEFLQLTKEEAIDIFLAV